LFWAVGLASQKEQVVAHQQAKGQFVQKAKVGKPGKLEIICSTPNCSFRVNAVVNASTVGVSGIWRYSTANLEHSCGGNVKRKRGYTVEALQIIATEQKQLVYVPTHRIGDRIGDVKQFIAQASGEGFDVKRGVALKIIQSKTLISPLAEFTQFSLLPAYVRALETHAPLGRYLLCSTGVSGGNRFTSLYIRPSGAQELFELGLSTASLDGASVKTILQGTLLVFEGSKCEQ
jgi:hypothetical protein